MVAKREIAIYLPSAEAGYNPALCRSFLFFKGDLEVLAGGHRQPNLAQKCCYCTSMVQDGSSSLAAATHPWKEADFSESSAAAMR
jgi:hypothetical protein